MDREIYRYSEAFKIKVVGEIERGKYKSVNEAKEVYGIGGGSTVNRWVKKYGKSGLINKIVRVEMKGERDKIKELKKRNRELERVLADSQIKNLALESLVEVANEYYGTDLKKNFGMKVQKEAK